MPIRHFGLPPAFRGGGLCIVGEDLHCPKVYENLNLGAEFSFLKKAGVELSGIGLIELRSFDPLHVAADLGIGFKYVGGPVAIKAAPQMAIAVNKRAEQPKTFIALPVQVALQATPDLGVFLDTGLFGPVAVFSGSYNVPVGVGANFVVIPTLDVGAELMFPRFLTSVEGPTAFDVRIGMIYAALRTK